MQRWNVIVFFCCHWPHPQNSRSKRHITIPWEDKKQHDFFFWWFPDLFQDKSLAKKHHQNNFPLKIPIRCNRFCVSDFIGGVLWWHQTFCKCFLYFCTTALSLQSCNLCINAQVQRTEWKYSKHTNMPSWGLHCMCVIVFCCHCCVVTALVNKLVQVLFQARQYWSQQRNVKKKKRRGWGVEPASHSFGCLLHLSEKWTACSKHTTKSPVSSMCVFSWNYLICFFGFYSCIAGFIAVIFAQMTERRYLFSTLLRV